MALPAIPSQLATLAKPRPTSLPTRPVPQATAVPQPQPFPQVQQTFPGQAWIPPTVPAMSTAQFNMPLAMGQMPMNQQGYGAHPDTQGYQPFLNPTPPAVTHPTEQLQNTLMQPPTTMQQPGHIPMIQPSAQMLTPNAWPMPTDADGTATGMNALGNLGAAGQQF